MTDQESKPQGLKPPKPTFRVSPLTSHRGHTLPRRTSPENSITLQHHRLAHEASMKAAAVRPPSILVNKGSSGPPRRNSSGESHDTGHSDPKKWFDQSNENPTASYSQAMDDPPFYQKETDSSNEDAPKATYPFHLRPGAPTSLRPAVTHSSSTDEYRSVIDDLTVEIQRLKEELKRYKQLGPELLKKEKLFEIKVHGLPKRKKRELEATLRDFAAGLDETPSAEASSAARKKSSRHGNRLYSGSQSISKHASSSSGSNSRPVDSAYASMSTGPNSSGTSLNRPSMSSRARSSEQKVESYLNDIPEGLYPHHIVMTDKEKKKLVVRRLEQLFTGKITGRNLQVNSAVNTGALAPVFSEAIANTSAMVHQPPGLGQTEPAREARILAEAAGKKSRSRDNASTENSNGDQTESGGNSTNANNGDTNNSPPNAPPPEQRPTRPRDLDPDRAQNPSENMDYIRHLGLVPPELLPESKKQDVAPDADGWVYLNLLCNLAQLHMVNVTPDFIRTAVSEKSTKFQLSPDGRKIRWRGGCEGTRFNSDSSGNNSQKSPFTDDTDGSNKNDQRKKQKTVKVQTSSGDDFTSALSSNPSKFGPQISGSSESFHYKPLFVQQQSSSVEQTSLDDTTSSFDQGEESHVGESRWGNSGSGSSHRRKRRLDGAIIYYSGAPFCTDLSGDPGDVSPATYMTSSGQEGQQLSSAHASGEFVRPDPPPRSGSGSALRFRPLSDRSQMFSEAMAVDPEIVMPSLTTDDSNVESDIEVDCSWSNGQQPLHPHTLEPCGLGGVIPEDHFMVLVATRRPKQAAPVTNPYACRSQSEETTDSIIHRLESMSTSPCPPISRPQNAAPKVEIVYMSGSIKRLAPVTLPPPAYFIPPFSSDESSDSDDGLGSDADDDEFESSDAFVGRRAQRHASDNPYPDYEMSSGDEEGEEPDDEDEPRARSSSHKGMDIALPSHEMRRTSSSAIAAPGTVRGRSKSMSADLPGQTGSSNATVGDAESGYSSSGENSG